MRWDCLKITPAVILVFAVAASSQTRQPCSVLRVLDSCRVELGSGEIVRLTGVQPFPQSSIFHDTLVVGKLLWRESDEKLPPVFVHLWRDSLLLNVELLRRGAARVWDDTVSFRYREIFLAAEHEARAARRGNWKLFSAAVDTAPSVAEDTVYVSKSGTKYHRANCRLLPQNRTALPLSKARLEYSPCRLCAVSTSAKSSFQPNGESAAPQCLGKTKNGGRCKRAAEAESQYCWQHRRK